MNALLPSLLALFNQFLIQTAPVPENLGSAVSVKPAAEKNFAEVTELLAENPDYWSAPFVLADVANKTVTVWGQNTGMGVGEPLEFFVISEQSGHDYEALMISFAKPSDIHQALEKIGANPGGPVSPNDHRFWPRGSRIVAEIEWQPNGSKNPVRMPVEKTALYMGEDMPVTPWVFTGAPYLPNPQNESEMVYGPDLFSPNSISSCFNLQNTVLDLPFQGSKTQTYGNFIRNPAVDAPAAQPMLLHLRMATEDEVETAVDLDVRFYGPEVRIDVEGLENPGFPDLSDLGAFLNKREGEIHYLQPDFGPELSLKTIRKLSGELDLMETHLESVRIEPPVEGQLYYKAFIPVAQYRNRNKRPTQPIELHFEKSGESEWNVTLMELEEIWSKDKPPVVLETPVPLESPKDLETYLEDPDNQNPVLFIYSDNTLTHQELQNWVRPVLDQFPVVYVYGTGE